MVKLGYKGKNNLAISSRNYLRKFKWRTKVVVLKSI